MGMPFQGRFDRARKLQKEKKAMRNEDDAPIDWMEKGDGLAMLLAGLLTILPIALIVVGVLAAVGYFFVVR